MHPFVDNIGHFNHQALCLARVDWASEIEGTQILDEEGREGGSAHI